MDYNSLLYLWNWRIGKVVKTMNKTMSINYKKKKIIKVKFLSLIKDFQHLEVKMNSHCTEKIL